MENKKKALPFKSEVLALNLLLSLASIEIQVNAGVPSLAEEAKAFESCAQDLQALGCWHTCGSSCMMTN